MSSPSPLRHNASRRNSSSRDHLFISYAYEEEALAEWLALRLTSEGYKVWIDRFELLGGESYPADIDHAIKRRTFRMIALLSRSSLVKPNPLKERTLALNIQRTRREEFLITLNVDDLRPDEMDWMTSDITFIPFCRSWAAGLAQLLKKLARVDAPKQVADGRTIAANAYLATNTLSHEPEHVYSNLLHIAHIPAAISCYATSKPLSQHAETALAQRWAFWARRSNSDGDAYSNTLYFSFGSPPSSTWRSYGWVRKVTSVWQDVDTICGIASSHVLKPLLRRALLLHLQKRGLQPTPDDPHIFYFPGGLLRNDLIRFKRPDGRRVSRRVAGERAWRPGERFAYHQAVTFDICTDLPGQYSARFRIRLHITDCDGNPLPTVAANARRRRLTRDWYNREWLARHLALLAFIADGRDVIDIFEDGSLVILASLIRLRAPFGIDETVIPKGTPFIRSSLARNDDER